MTLLVLSSGQDLSSHPTGRSDSGQHHRPSGHCDVSCDAQSKPADHTGGQSPPHAAQRLGAAQGAGRHGHR